jgi:hypothetical protein
MRKNLIKKYSSSIIRGLMERVNELSDLEHRLTKGELRELFISTILRSFLTNQYEIGSGIIINQKGKQSKQTDIIIYDNRILPPFIREKNLGIFPAESVLATIEVKSYLGKKEIVQSEKAAKELIANIYNPEDNAFSDYTFFQPLCAVIGFIGGKKDVLENERSGWKWLRDNIKYLSLICLTNRYLWTDYAMGGWDYKKGSKDNNVETKKFIAGLVDDIRTISAKRLEMMSREYNDYLSTYILEEDS